MEPQTFNIIKDHTGRKVCKVKDQQTTVFQHYSDQRATFHLNFNVNSAFPVMGVTKLFSEDEVVIESSSPNLSYKIYREVRRMCNSLALAKHDKRI